VNKKKQKTLLIWAVPVSALQAQISKAFAPFLIEKAAAFLGPKTGWQAADALLCRRKSP
jgi:hypothetical protein